MADASTTYFGLVKPEVGASADSWGGKINDNSDGLDALLGRGSFFGTYGGTANTITVALPAAILVYTAGLQLRFRATVANTGAVTINGKPTATVTGAPLPLGYIRTDVDTVATYDGTKFVVDRQIERGSNANGSYTKYADGTMTCRFVVSPGPASNSAFGNIFANASDGTWTFPANFATTDNLVVSAGVRVAGATWARGRTSSTTAAAYRRFSAVADTASAEIELQASGYWG